MKLLTEQHLSKLVENGSVFRAFLTPYPAIDGGGWFVDFDHTDDSATRHLYTSRCGLRLFDTSDDAIKTLHKCGFGGSVVLLDAKI